MNKTTMCKHGHVTNTGEKCKHWQYINIPDDLEEIGYYFYLDCKLCQAKIALQTIKDQQKEGLKAMFIPMGGVICGQCTSLLGIDEQ